MVTLDSNGFPLICQAKSSWVRKSLEMAPLDSLSRNLRRARVAAGLSQKEAAQLADVTVQAVSGWERGVNRPREDNIAALATAYGTTAAALRYGDDAEAEPGRVAELSLPTFDRTPYYKTRLSPAAYERLYGYLERLQKAGYDDEQLETAERIMVDPRYAKLNKSRKAGTTPSDGDVLTFIDAGWAVVWELATMAGVKVPGPRPRFGKAEEGA